MVKMQFPLNDEYGNDGKIHEIVPTRLFYKDFGEKQCYLLMSYRNDFDYGVIKYESIIIRDEDNFACIHSNVKIDVLTSDNNYEDININNLINDYQFSEIKIQEYCPDFIDLGESINCLEYLSDGCRFVTNSEYIPVLDPKIGSREDLVFTGNAFTSTVHDGKFSFEKAATFKEKDEVIEKIYDSQNTLLGESVFSLTVDKDTFGHIISYGVNAECVDIPVLILSGDHKYNILFGEMRNPIDYKMSWWSNRFNVSNVPGKVGLRECFSNIEKYDKEFFFPDNKKYTSKVLKGRER